MKKVIFAITCFFFLSFGNAYAKDSTSSVAELSGPRVGMTYLSSGKTQSYIDSPMISQYGWQFETKFASGEGVQGLVEWVVLAGGMEKGLFLPSISSLVGLRNAAGYEFAMGPNLSLSGISYVLAAGKNFRIGELNVPVNLSWVPEHDDSSHRVSMTVGFNMRR